MSTCNIRRNRSTRLNNASPKPVLWRLLPSLAVIVILLIVGAGALLYQQHRESLAGEIAAHISDVSEDLRMALDQQASGLASAAQSIGANANVQKALRESDADRLLADWRSLFETLHRENSLTHFYFFDANRVCLLRLHRPEKRGDRIERFTILEAERTCKTASGIELGPLGTFTLRVVHPIFEGGALVGYVELGKEIEDVLQTMHTWSSTQHAVIIRKEHLNRQTWEAGMRMLGREADWDRLPRNVVIYDSHGRLPDAFAVWADSFADDHVHGEKDRKIAFDRQDWRVSAIPMLDASGKEVGDLLIIYDNTAKRAAFTHLLALSGTAGAMLLALLMGFIYFLLHRTDAGIRTQQEALRESEDKFKSFAEQSFVGIYLIQDGVFQYVNPRFAQIFGYSVEECAKMHFRNLVFPEDLEKVEEQVRRQIFGGVDFVQYKFSGIKKNREVIHVEIYGSSVSYEGKPAAIGTMLDITERKQAEEALRKSEEKLDRAHKMESMGLLAGGVAHDLNNVLSGIVSYPELILLDLPEDSKFRKPIETIQESGHRAAAIVQDLLTVARGVATTKEVLNLNTLIGDYLDSPEFKKLEQFYPTVTAETNLDKDLFKISGSHVHIRKVLMNLVANAAEAIEGSGNVTISTTNRYVDRPLRGYDDVNIGEYAILSVSDDGSGISSDDLERIFEPFYTKKIMGRSGTGLGLAVVWNVVQDHKGYIDVVTGENGTTFELYFPITRGEISDKALSISIKDYKGNQETILIVDDMESQREISCKMLDKLGYKTKAISSGEEAVEYLKENTVDLIVLDMIMDPGINGRETYEKIIKIHPKQKAIIVSGFAETGDVKEAQRLGAGQYIKKPLTFEKLGLAVKEELEK